MPSRLRSRLLVLFLALPLCGGCGMLRRPLPPVDRSQDARIRSEIVARLSAEPALGADSIRVEVDGRTVSLYGSVHGLGAWRCALRNAQLVEGVSRVVDYLVLERGPRDAACRAPGGAGGGS